MPRTQNITVQNNFIKGLITEATALTYPENSCQDTDNCEFDRTGIVSRRPRFDFEDNWSEEALSITNRAITTYLWKNVAGEGDLSFLVYQNGNTLHFYRTTGDSPLSGNKHADTIALTAHVPAGITTVASLECQFASGNGLLFVTNPNVESFYVEYDIDTDTLTATEITLRARDFEGDITDALEDDDRPTSTKAALTAAHRYNLLNQGWKDSQLTDWDTNQTTMPSNADVNWYFKDADDKFDFTATSKVDHVAIGNSKAPRGHFKFNIYDFDRNSKFSGATSYEIATDRVSTCAFYAGRVWYSGLQYPKHTSKIYFSQIVETSDQYGKCFQTNDPTSEKLFDLLPSDGGVIDLIEAGPIIKMVPVLNSLMVFSTNGIWAITGSQGTGFAANDYTINKISSIASISPSSFIDVDGLPLWWNIEGIYAITAEDKGFKVSSLTDLTIKTFYQEIPLESKKLARGTYDAEAGKIQWIYRSTASEDFEDKYIFDRLLNFSTITQAFFPWSMDTTTVHVHAINNITGVGGSFEETNVIATADTVQDGSDDVVAFLAATGGVTSVTKYLVGYVNSGANQITFAESREDDPLVHTDWVSSDDVGVDYDSYFVTGHYVHGQGNRDFQENYLTLHIKNMTEDEYEEAGGALSPTSYTNSFLIRGRWGFAGTGSTGRWSTAQTVSTNPDDFEYKPKRVKIRGHGLACQLEVNSVSHYPFNIAGWSVFESANRWV